MPQQDRDSRRGNRPDPRRRYACGFVPIGFAEALLSAVERPFAASDTPRILTLFADVAKAVVLFQTVSHSIVICKKGALNAPGHTQLSLGVNSRLRAKVALSVVHDIISKTDRERLIKG